MAGSGSVTSKTKTETVLAVCYKIKVFCGLYSYTAPQKYEGANFFLLCKTSLHDISVSLI